MGRVPIAERVVTLRLNWKRDKSSRPELVGRFRLEMDALVSRGYARKIPGWYVLRFQRSGDRIEVAVNRSKQALPLPVTLRGYSA
jgi:hypothetical protein